jgi:hypothetical protein
MSERLWTAQEREIADRAGRLWGSQHQLGLRPQEYYRFVAGAALRLGAEMQLDVGSAVAIDDRGTTATLVDPPTRRHAHVQLPGEPTTRRVLLVRVLECTRAARETGTLTTVAAAERPAAGEWPGRTSKRRSGETRPDLPRYSLVMTLLAVDRVGDLSTLHDCADVVRVGVPEPLNELGTRWLTGPPGPPAARQARVHVTPRLDGLEELLDYAAGFARTGWSVEGILGNLPGAPGRAVALLATGDINTVNAVLSPQRPVVVCYRPGLRRGVGALRATSAPASSAVRQAGRPSSTAPGQGRVRG